MLMASCFRWLNNPRPLVRCCRPMLEQLENRLVPTVTLDPIQPQVVFENQLLTFQVTAKSTDEDVAPVFVFSFDLAQPGATIDPKTGVINWTAGEDNGAAGFNFTVRVTDLRSEDMDTETFNVLVLEVNEAPALQPISNQTITQGGTAVVQAIAGDDDNPPNGIVFSLTAAPGGATINPVSGVFQWNSALSQPPGVFAVTVRAASANAPGLFEETTFLITVTPLLTDIAPFQFLAAGFRQSKSRRFQYRRINLALANLQPPGALPPPPRFLAPQGPGSDTAMRLCAISANHSNCRWIGCRRNHSN